MSVLYTKEASCKNATKAYFARDDSNFGHGRLGERVEQLGTVSNDSAVLLARS